MAGNIWDDFVDVVRCYCWLGCTQWLPLAVHHGRRVIGRFRKRFKGAGTITDGAAL